MRQAAAAKESAAADKYLEDFLSKSETEFCSSPIKRSGNTFSFLHKTVQEYFVALHVSQELTNLTGDPDDRSSLFNLNFRDAIIKGDWSSLAIGKKLLTAGNVFNTLRFCADMVDGRAQAYVSFGPVMNLKSGVFEAQAITVADASFLPDWDSLQPSARTLWDIVQVSRLPASRSNSCAATAAANAMMILNAGGMVFGGCDLSYATLGPVSDADDTAMPKDQRNFMDVSGGVFDGADLSRAILTKARMDGCSFDHGTLEQATLMGVTLGQQPMLQGHTGRVNCLCIFPASSSLLHEHVVWLG